jgi:hypothetical protein
LVIAKELAKHIKACKCKYFISNLQPILKDLFIDIAPEFLDVIKAFHIEQAQKVPGITGVVITTDRKVVHLKGTSSDALERAKYIIIPKMEIIQV